jgi:hypothetical protein
MKSVTPLPLKVSAIAFASAIVTVLIAGCTSTAAAPKVGTLEAGVLSVCLYPGFAPFGEQDDKGEFVGWDVSYLKEFAAREGLRFQSVVAKSFDGIWLEPAKNTCDIAASGISDKAERRTATGTGAQWSQHYYNGLRAFLVRSGDAESLSKIEDLRGRTVVVTGNSTADYDLRNRLQLGGITTTKILNTTNDEDAAKMVRDAGPTGEPFAFGAGLGSLKALADRLEGLAVVWPHCNMLADGTGVQEPFSFVVRSESGGLLDALNGFIASPDAKYEGASEAVTGCAPLPSS